MSLSFCNVRKVYSSLRGQIVAIRDVTLSVEEGEFFVLLGPSGCGKSTLLNLAAGLERPTRGEILLGGRKVAAGGRGAFVSPRERNVAMVFQSYALYPHLTVFGNIAFPLRVSGTDRGRIAEAVEEAAGMLGISDLLPARPAELSGGQRQRVAIARAIVRKPRIFLLDEPLSNLDAGLRASTRSDLKRLQRTLGVTTLYVTHDQTEAMTLGDRIALLRGGDVVQTGTPGELYHAPNTPFAASFVGQVPMNLLPARIREEAGVLYLLLGPERIRVPESGAARLRDIGRPDLLLGIRPEHVQITPEPSGSGILGRIEAVEHLGREFLLQVRLQEETLKVLSASPSLREGDPVRISFSFEDIRWFPPLRNG
jgi:multiple sugar transport system ATP-binding protein